MPAWIGKPGSLFEVQCPSALSVSEDRPGSVKQTLAGRVKGQQAPGRSRQWKVGYDLVTPDALASVKDLVRWGIPPIVWIGPEAAASNMLTPAGGALRPGTWRTPAVAGRVYQTGEKVIAEEVGVRAMTASSLTTTYGDEVRLQRVPVVPMLTYTVSVRGLSINPTITPMILRAHWLDQFGQEVGRNTSQTRLDRTELGRISTTGKAPARAAFLEIEITQAAVIAAPQVTVGPVVRRWAPGEGSNSVMVGEFSADVGWAIPNRVDRHYAVSSAGFTVTDLGE